MIWLVFALMVFLSIGLFFLPRLSGRFSIPGSRTEKEKVLGLYQRQLKSLKKEVEAGLIPKEEARAYRTELERRLLEESKRKTDIKKATLPKAGGLLPVLAIAVLAGSAYMAVGHPGFDYVPEKRIDPRDIPAGDGGPTIGSLLEDLQTHLKKNPEDLQGWQLLGNTAATLGEFNQAANAYGRAAELAQNSTTKGGLHARQAESLVLMSSGMVTPAAKWAIRQALLNSPDQFLARYYLGLGLFQDGNAEAALEVWKELAREMPETVPWRERLLQGIEVAERMRENSS